jgi:UDP-glucose 6-dehydrogenase
MEQVITEATLAAAFGNVVFVLTVTTELVEQLPNVVVSVYEPPLETVVAELVGAVPPGDQA